MPDLNAHRVAPQVLYLGIMRLDDLADMIKDRFLAHNARTYPHCGVYDNSWTCKRHEGTTAAEIALPMRLVS